MRQVAMEGMRARVLFSFLAVLVTSAAWCGSAAAEDAPPPPPGPPIERLFAPAREALVGSNLPPFIRDTDLRLHLRSYYFNRTNPNDSINEAWAFGGWITYQSGWLFDTFAMGASLYGSAKLYGPDDRDGTTLLKPGQEGYYVPAEAWGALRYKEYALLTGYRHKVEQPYVNSNDNRMTPNTFEGVTLGGKVGWLQYFAGYLWKIKPRNADEFIDMSEQAGAAGSNDGTALIGFRLTPVEGLRFDIANNFGINTMNTFYVEGAYVFPISENWKLGLGAQFTDQRAVGDALMARADGRYWDTQQGGVRVQAFYRDLQITGAFSVTGAGNKIQNPWGSFPGYLSLIDQDFNRANEKAVLIGAAYDFSKVLLQGLSANVNFAWGWDAIDASTRRKAPDQGEYDFTVDYRPPFNLPVLQGMWFRARAAVLDQQNGKTTGYQFRLILNWERNLI